MYLRYGGASRIKNGGSSNLMERRICKLAYTQVAPASWRQVRQETRICQQEQLNRSRFRHRPLDYLAVLEIRWEQASVRGYCPHSLKSPR